LPKVLLDTDIFSEILKSVDRRIVRRAEEYIASEGPYAISSITVMEIVKGLRKKGQQERIAKFVGGLATVPVLDFDAASAELAGRMAADLEESGQPIGRADPMLAAIALRNNLTLVTGNLSHFGRIVSCGYPLSLDNWRA